MIALTADFEREILFYHAYTLDRKNSPKKLQSAQFMEAVKAFTDCIESPAAAQSLQTANVYSRRNALPIWSGWIRNRPAGFLPIDT